MRALVLRTKPKVVGSTEAPVFRRVHRYGGTSDCLTGGITNQLAALHSTLNFVPEQSSSVTVDVLRSSPWPAVKVTGARIYAYLGVVPSYLCTRGQPAIVILMPLGSTFQSSSLASSPSSSPPKIDGA